MGKKSKQPAFSNGVLSINGQEKASTYKQGNNVVTNYNMSDAEKRAYDYAQNSFADSLSKVNIFDEDTKKNLQSEIDAYTARGEKLINNVYTPMLNNLKADVASRFGNFDNSVFMDNLNSIEANRANSIKDLALDVNAKRSELISNELSQRYSYLGFLQDVQNQVNANMFNFVNASQQNSSLGNDYSNQTSNKSSNSGLSNFANVASGIADMFSKYSTF